MSNQDFLDRRSAKGLMDHWQLIIVVLGFIAACFKFYFTVDDLSTNQAKWQNSSEVRREKTRDEMESLRFRQGIMEKDIEWLKKGRVNG